MEILVNKASDILMCHENNEYGDEPDFVFSFECPVCGSVFEYHIVESKHSCLESGLFSINTFSLDCQNKKCDSSFVYSNLSKIQIDDETNTISGREIIGDYMSFVDTPHINDFIPSYMQREFKLAYECLSISPEASGVYVRKILELMLNETWSEIKNATSNKKLSLYKKLEIVHNKGYITDEDWTEADKIRDIFNSSAHVGTNAENMTEEDVTTAFKILLKLVRKYAFKPEISVAEKIQLDNLAMKFGM